MKLNISDWKSFSAADISFLYNGSGLLRRKSKIIPVVFLLFKVELIIMGASAI